MSAYQSLAFSYDRLTQDVPYPEVLLFLERLMQHCGKKPESVLDLACGTGSLSVLMAKKGYRVLGVDASVEMLTEAAMKLSDDNSDNRPYFICQKMQQLRLPYRVDAVVSCLDSLNYLIKPEDLRKTFHRVYRALNNGGIFLFDMNTPAKFRAMDGQVFLDEDDDVFCLWRAIFSRETQIMTYGIDLFERKNKMWQRSREEHMEYCYEPEDVRAWLREEGFTKVEIYGDRKLEAPEDNEQRIYFTACREAET